MCNYRNAVIDFKKAIKINKEDWKTYLGRGIGNYHLGSYEFMVKDLKKALKLNPQCK